MVTIDYLYKVQIDCSTYEPQIDSDNIVRVTLLDFNNNPVINTEVIVDCDKGGFYDNSNYTSIVKQEVTTTKNSNSIVFNFNGFSVNQGMVITVTDTNNNITNVNINKISQLTVSGNTATLTITGVNSVDKVEVIPLIENNILYTGYNRDVSELSLETSSFLVGVTNNEGYVDFLYEANEWGFVNILAGNNNVNLYVTGFRKVPLVQGTNYQKVNTSYSDDPFKNYKVLWYDDSIGIAKIKLQYYANFKNGSSASTFSNSSSEAVAKLIFNSQPSTDSNTTSLTTNSSSNLKGDLVPTVSIRRHWYRPDFVIYLTSSVQIVIRTDTTNGQPSNGAWVPLEWRYLTENVSG